MRADVTKIFCLLGDGTYGMDLWRVDLEDIARQNLDKLADRQKRGVIASQGDNR